MTRRSNEKQDGGGDAPVLLVVSPPANRVQCEALESPMRELVDLTHRMACEAAHLAELYKAETPWRDMASPETINAVTALERAGIVRFK